MAVSIIEPGSTIRAVGSIGGSSAGTYTRTVKGTGRYLIWIQRTNGTDAYLGLYMLQVYLRTGSNASSNKANLVAIKTPSSGLTSLTVTASTSDDTATITYVSSTSNCFCYVTQMSQ